MAGGEVAITNLRSCNGSWTSQEANAHLKCVYFSVTKGGESIEMIIRS
ncbi:hypothetical protein Patl1_34995 [Pistacia atlantica]|uniref:Uncharacterized protein n=1 Tax=Pistacia atlantica TaxID=434234 RepID=A0ACC0ZW09_9ROSI|nr:hypothetical protein Patl1_34995 [Pistacia atlantica]